MPGGESVLLEGTAPLPVSVRSGLSNQTHAGLPRDAVTRLEIDFEDGTVIDAPAALFVAEEYRTEHHAQLPVEQVGRPYIYHARRV
jgi:hypothetical protein